MRFFSMKMYEFRLKLHWSLFPWVWINNIRAFVQIMAWCRPADKLLSEPMMVILLTHICVTRPQCVKTESQNSSYGTWLKTGHKHYFTSIRGVFHYTWRAPQISSREVVNSLMVFPICGIFCVTFWYKLPHWVKDEECCCICVNEIPVSPFTSVV